MRFCQAIIISAFVLMSLSIADAAEKSENDFLPSEKAQLIYDTLLSREENYKEQKNLQDETVAAKMTTKKMSEILQARHIGVQGTLNQCQFIYDNAEIFLLTDPHNNRMRVMTPLARLDILRQKTDFNEINLLQMMMSANYLATGDVRLCTNRHIIWAVFLHPLDSLTKRDFVNALQQLAEIAKNTRSRME